MNEKIKKTLKHYFGFENFRAFQQEAIEAILDSKDLFMVLPTGGGKSLCYQLPALLKNATAIVVSPLIALMQDQVRSLQERGIEARMLASSNSDKEQEEVYEALAKGEVKLLYVAPERFGSARFLQLLTQIDISFFVIDEAHCVSEWGHEFRDDYRKLGVLKERFRDVPIAAFTATATQKVAQDIVNALHLQNPFMVRGKIFRENLTIGVLKRKGNGYGQIEAFLKRFSTDNGIIYTFTRKESERLAKHLQSKGFKALAYHAGLSNEIREGVYKAFVQEEAQIIVATVAFGMGIDKSNIRFVVHTSLPKTIEGYYQEIGRAGRDGLASHALLLYNNADRVQKQELIDQLPPSPYKETARRKLESMYAYALTSKCRHRYIANYFGDDIQECETVCDNCADGAKEQKEVTTQALMVLSAIFRLQEGFGQSYVIDVLRGSKAQKILQNRHDTLPLYGVGKGYSKKEFESVCEHLFDIGAIVRGEHQVLQLTDKAKKMLRLREKVFMQASRYEMETKIQNTDEQTDTQTLKALKELRREIAKESGIPAYMVFSDKTLQEISTVLPRTKEEMLRIGGVAQVKFERYGEAFLALCKSLASLENETAPKRQERFVDWIEYGLRFATLEELQENLNSYIEKKQEANLSR